MPNAERQKAEQQNRELTRSRQGTQLARRGALDTLTPAEFFSNPFSVMRRMHEEMDRVFSDAFGSRGAASGWGGGLASWSPVVEVSERDNQMVVCAELPGLKPEERQSGSDRRRACHRGRAQAGARRKTGRQMAL